MMYLLKQRAQFGKQLVGQLISFLMVVVPDLLILQVEFIVYIWERRFSKRSPGYEKFVSLSFVVFATDCSFDAMCHYLKLKILFICGNDSLETTCPIWKTIGRSAYIFSDGCCCCS